MCVFQRISPSKDVFELKFENMRMLNKYFGEMGEFPSKITSIKFSLVNFNKILDTLHDHFLSCIRSVYNNA